MSDPAGLPIDVAGFQTRRLSLRPAGFWRGAAILCDGVPAPRKGRTFTVNNDAGAPVIVQLKGMFFDPIPQVQVGDQRIVLARPFAWYEYVLIVLPLVLVAGGALGGACGAFAAYGNAQVLRMRQPLALRLAVAVGVAVAAALLYVGLAVLISAGVYHA
jgi:hypothetical protein